MLIGTYFPFQINMYEKKVWLHSLERSFPISRSFIHLCQCIMCRMWPWNNRPMFFNIDIVMWLFHCDCLMLFAVVPVAGFLLCEEGCMGLWASGSADGEWQVCQLPLRTLSHPLLKRFRLIMKWPAESATVWPAVLLIYEPIIRQTDTHIKTIKQWNSIKKWDFYSTQTLVHVDHSVFSLLVKKDEVLAPSCGECACYFWVQIFFKSLAPTNLHSYYFVLPL